MINKLSLFIIISIMTNFHSIHDLNNLRDEAENAFMTNDYATATKKYQLILEKKHSEACQLNLAHAYLLNKDTANAITSYQQTFLNTLKQSIAFSQLGVITFEKTGITSFQPLEKKQKKEVLDALMFFKNALKKDATNEIARYNYEVLKHLLELKEPEEKDKDKEENQDQKDDKNQDQQNKDKNDKSGQENKQQENKDKNGQEKKENSSKDKSDKENKDGKEGDNDKNQEKKDQENKSKESQKEKNDKIIDERLESQNMTKEQAQKLLNSTTQQETKYLQQIKKGGNKPKSNTKNDW